ncbi:hypothetical protein Tsubulata_042456, partial [Turnera subulata]
MNHLTVETEDAFASLLELAANNDVEGLRRSIERDPCCVDEIGLWYGRQKGSKQMVNEHRTPLMVAATYGSIDVIKLILSLSDADVNMSCGMDKSTALHCAAVGGAVNAVDVVKLLLAAGADPNLLDANGRRPIDVIVVPPKLNNVKLNLEELLAPEGSVGEGNLRVSTTTLNSNSPPLSPLLLPCSPSSVSVMSPSPFTPPISPSANGMSHSSAAWPQPNVPALHLPGSNMQSSRLRSSLNARDMPADYSSLSDFDVQQQQLLSELSGLSQASVGHNSLGRSGRLKTLTPSNLEDLFSAENSSSHYTDQALSSAVFSPTHKSAVLNQFQQQQNMPSPLGTNFSHKNADHTLLQTSFASGRMSPRSVEPISPMSSRASMLAQREKLQQQFRSLSSRELGSNCAGIVDSPRNSWSNWGSSDVKPDWSVHLDELRKHHRSNSSELVPGEGPDLSWVQSLVKESPTEIKEKSPVPLLSAAASHGHSNGGFSNYNMNHLTVETEDAFASLLELAANNDVEGLRRSIERDPCCVDEIGLWYGRQKGSKQMVNEHRTPLMVAATYGSIDVIKLILSLSDADVNMSCGTDKSTALHCAAAGGAVNAVDVVKLLLAAGADPNLLDANGRRPIDVIVVPPKLHSVKLILEELLATDCSVGERTLRSSRLRSSLNARDIPSDYSLLSDFDVQQQQLLSELSGLSHPSVGNNSLGRSGRLKTLTPSNLEDLFSAENSSSRYTDQALSSAVFSPTHKSAVLNQFQQQQSMLSPIGTNFSPKNVDHPLLQTSFASGRMSPRSMEPISPMSSRVSMLAQREKQQQQLRSLSSRELGSNSAGIVDSPRNSWSNWGSSNMKPDWSVHLDELGKHRRSNSSELGTGEEPDLSWVQSLVKESPTEMKDKSSAPLLSGAASHVPLNEGSNINSESVDHVVGSWIEQLQIDQLVAQQN